MFGRVDFSEDREKKKERKWGKTFWMLFGWEGERGKKWWGSSVFSLDPPKSSPQNREKTGWREIWGVNDEIAHVRCTWVFSCCPPPLFFFWFWSFCLLLGICLFFSFFSFSFWFSRVVLCRGDLFCLFISFFV